jgi:hypothetical protein
VLVSVLFVRRYLRNLDSRSFYVKGVIASVIPFIPVFLLSTFVSNRTLTLVPYTILGGLVILLCIRSMRLLTVEDRSFLAHVLPARFQRFLLYL